MKTQTRDGAWTILLCVLNLIVVSLFSALSAHAAPTATAYYVTGTSDSVSSCAVRGVGGFNCPSLRSAVIAANGNPGSTIVLSHGVTYTLSILRSGLDDATNGDLNITANTTVNFGNSVCFSNCPATIQGGPGWNDRLVNVGPGATVQISGVVFRNGNVPTNGGGIYNSGHLTLLNSTIISNTASGYGGGIVSSDNFGFSPSLLTLDTTNVLSNTAVGNAGGVYVFGSASVTNSSIANNYTDAQGGGLVAQGAVTLTNTSVVSNTAVSAGGGVTFISGTLTIAGGAIDSNRAIGSPSCGGGLNFQGSVVIDGTDISHNESLRDGGGICVPGSNAALTMDNATVNSNQSIGLGGGIFFSGSAADIASSTVNSNNSGSGSGGGLFINGGTVRVTNTHVDNNSTTSGDGAGLEVSGGSLSLTTSTLSGNHTSTGNGGSILLTNGRSMTVTATTLDHNSARSGGGIYAIGPFTLTNSTISTNTTSGSAGGGIYQATDSALLTNVTITGNQAPTSTGGGIEIFGSMSVKNSLIAGNTNPSAPDCWGNLTSLGDNLLGNSVSCHGLSNGVNGDLVGSLGSPINPLLAPLANVGGSTRTHALLANSPALDKIPNGSNGCGTTITQDQRGFLRPLNGLCDIGAVEGSPHQVSLPFIER